VDNRALNDQLKRMRNLLAFAKAVNREFAQRYPARAFAVRLRHYSDPQPDDDADDDGSADRARRRAETAQVQTRQKALGTTNRRRVRGKSVPKGGRAPGRRETGVPTPSRRTRRKSGR
jgi:hypothetical protein